MKVLSTIQWPCGEVTTRHVDMDNHAEKRRFAFVARAALEKGAVVSTKRCDQPENHLHAATKQITDHE